jgi:hypothetical protein
LELSFHYIAVTTLIKEKTTWQPVWYNWGMHDVSRGISNVYHQTEGGEMKKCSRLLAGLVAVLTAVVLTGCVTVLTLDYSPVESPDNVLGSVAPVKIKLTPFADKRESAGDPKLIGGVKRAVIAQVEDVLSENGIPDVIHSALSEEFARNGHSIVDSDEDFIVGGEIRTFWLYTDITADAPNEWDVIAEIKIFMEVVNASTGDAALAGPYSGKNMELRFIVPDGTIYTRVVEAAMSDMLRNMNSDTGLATMLGKK